MLQVNSSAEHKKRVPGKAGSQRTTFAIAATVLLSGVLYWAVAGHSLRPAGTAVETYEKASHLVRDGQRLRVPENSPLRRKLTIEPVAEREIQRTLVLPAVVEADPARVMKIVPPLAGRVTRLAAQLGDRVEKGQPLAVLDSPDLGTYYAEYDRAKALLALAQKNRDRQRELARAGGTAVKDQLQAETDYVTAEVESQRAEARLRQIGVDAEAASKSRMVTISAPVGGSVIDLAVAPGAYWNDPTAVMMTVSDLSTVWVTANVPESNASLIAKGQAVEVTFRAYPNETFQGEVLFVSDVVDPDTRRTKVRIAFQNPGTRLKPNMFASARFLAPGRRMPVVPAAALVLRDETDQVFVEVEPWTFEARAVDIDFHEGEHAVIRSGVRTGDKIVVRGGVLLND